MGCYVLLKSRLVKENRSENCYTARNYTMSVSYGFHDSVKYNLSYTERWKIAFDLHEIKYICFAKMQNHYYTIDEMTLNRTKAIKECLANCRFDLVHQLINKLI
jgi:hypothetical protein